MLSYFGITMHNYYIRLCYNNCHGIKKEQTTRGRQTQSEGTIWSRSEKDFRQTAL